MAQRVVYRIKPSSIFFASNFMFVPATEYVVSEDVYNGLTADGKNVKDLCSSATQETEEI
jgi:hypothetical protein